MSNCNHTFIIAEAGVNHNGNISIAKQLIDAAAAAGADAVKFQTFKAGKLVSRKATKANYQKQTTNKDESQFDMLKKLELGEELHKQLMAYCKTKNIVFLSTPFDLDSIQLLKELGLNIFKIPSGEITNLPYLRDIGKLNKQVILSTGMSDMTDIENALDILTQEGTSKDKITVLHANTMYPTPMQDVNLRAMQSIGKRFEIKYGYSDHTLGIEVDIAAVAMGASIIEKHFTLDKTMPGPDHKASLEPDELKLMVKLIRNIELAMGSKEKKPSESEIPNIKTARKSIVAAKSIVKGDIFTEQNITTKRPALGMNPMHWNKVVGTTAKKNYRADDLI